MLDTLVTIAVFIFLVMVARALGGMVSGRGWCSC